VHTALLTDEQRVARHPLSVDFDELIEIDPPWQAETAAEIEQTHFAKCFVQAIDFLQSARPPFVLWCHLGALGTTWDAPQEFRELYCEPGDPPPPTAAEVPDLLLPDDYDPDELLGISQAYSGQVSLLDACLGAFVEYLRGSPLGKDTLLALTSARGFPLGEHGRVGPCDDAPYSELVHVPLMLRFPDLRGASARSHALVEPADLWATLLDWWQIADRPPSPTGLSLMPAIDHISGAAAGSSGSVETTVGRAGHGPKVGRDVLVSDESFRDRVCIKGQAHVRAIHTPAWYMLGGVEPIAGRKCDLTRAANGGTDAGHADGEQPDSSFQNRNHLFAKPDDRWDVNDVASRCGEVAECLTDALDQYEQALQSGTIAALPPLGDVLLNGLE
jgi:hypothetical protein